MTVTVDDRSRRAAELARRAWTEALSDRARRSAPADDGLSARDDGYGPLRGDVRDPERDLETPDDVQAEVLAMVVGDLDDGDLDELAD